MVENFPAGHWTQVEAAAASTAAEYVPGSQLVQTEAPPPEYVPAAQDSHLEAELAAAVLTDFPATHGTQVEAPAPGPEYVPAVQSVQAEAPSIEYVPAQQFWSHQLAVVAPVLVEYFPAGHLKHVLAPLPDCHVPALQMVQAADPHPAA